MRAASGDAGIRIADESPLEALPHRIIDQVMHNPVAEVSGPDFANFWVLNHERDAAPNFIPPFHKIAVKANEIGFQIGLEGQLIDCVPLMLATSEIGVKHCFQGECRRDRGRESISGHSGRRFHCS